MAAAAVVVAALEESCLKDYPATVCCADELPAHVGVSHCTFIVNTDTCDRGGSHRMVFHFPRVGPRMFRFAGKRTGSVSPPFRQCPDRQRTAMLLLFVSNPPDDTDICGLYCLYYFKRRHRGMKLADIVKDFSTVDLKGNEDKILRSNC